jgi:hypothetical protein
LSEPNIERHLAVGTIKRPHPRYAHLFLIVIPLVAFGRTSLPECLHLIGSIDAEEQEAKSLLSAI